MNSVDMTRSGAQTAGCV